MFLILTHVLITNILLSQVTSELSTNDCGKTVKCFKYPKECLNNSCDIVYKWKNSTLDNSIEFELNGRVMNSPSWLAIGFSKDKQMGDDGVVACKSNGRVDHYYNTNEYRPRMLVQSEPSIGIFDSKVQLNDNIFSCSFKRKIKNDSVLNYFDLNTAYYVLSASGPYDPLNDFIRQHEFRESSDNLINFLDSSTSVNLENEATVGLNGTCGKTKGCFTSGDYVIEWQDNGLNTNFYVSLKVSRPSVWFAVGLSNDRKMGDDCVIICKSGNGINRVEHYFNQGAYTPNLLSSSDPTIGLTQTSISFQNGLFECKFARRKEQDNVANYFNANAKSYYFIAAWGDYTSSTDRLVPHSPNAPITSSQMFELTAFGLLNQQDNLKVSLAKVHGILMIISWVLLAPFGIIMARYFKHLGGDKKLCGVNIWFSLHRPALVLATALTLAGFVLILYDKDWKWINANLYENKVNFSHSIFGIFTITFSVVQVLLGVFRHDKDHPRRYLFNVFHRSIGFLSFIFSTITILFGTLIDGFNEFLWKIFLAWTVWILILPLSFEVLTSIYENNKKSHKVEPKEQSLELKDVQSKEDSMTVSQDRKIFNEFKLVFLCIHVLLSAAFTILLSVYLFVEIQ